MDIRDKNFIVQAKYHGYSFVTKLPRSQKGEEYPYVVETRALCAKSKLMSDKVSKSAGKR